jgi:hypothetical protein
MRTTRSDGICAVDAAAFTNPWTRDIPVEAAHSTSPGVRRVHDQAGIVVLRGLGRVR